jgi:hypothetical protein
MVSAAVASCPLLSACCCWRRYLCRSQGELSTHLALQALFTQSSPVCEPLLQVFPFPSTLGEVTLHPLSQACMFIYSSRGKWVFPPFLWSFTPSATLTSFPSPGGWVCTPTPAGASPARPARLFTVLGRIPFPQSSVLSAPHPLSHVSLLFLLPITQFLFFPPVEVSLSRGLCCSGPGLSVEVPRYR